MMTAEQAEARPKANNKKDTKHYRYEGYILILAFVSFFKNLMTCSFSVVIQTSTCVDAPKIVDGKRTPCPKPLDPGFISSPGKELTAR